MEILIVSIGLVISLGVFLGVKKILKEHHREEVKSRLFPKEWLEILESNVAIYKYLPDFLKNELHGYIHLFVEEKYFEGCEGLEITDEIQVTIAAQACVLLLNRKNDFYPDLERIYVYPHAYFSDVKKLEAGVVMTERVVRSGESWLGGPVALAWDYSKHGASNAFDGKNVVMHEFAHQLDQEDGRSDGAPVIEESHLYSTFCKVLGAKFKGLKKRVEANKKTLIDEYGATNEAEFFAVLTETFFEKSRQLKKKHPKLYNEMKDYYHLDPAEWF